MAELASTNSISQHPQVTEQPTRASRWWIRHYRHIGLASSAGSAILVCVIAFIVLPNVVNQSSTTTNLDNELCSSYDIDYLEKTTPLTIYQTVSTDVSFVLPINQSVTIDRLCGENAIWKDQGITVAGSSDGVDSSTHAGLKNPSDLIVDSNENLFIADLDNNRIVFWPNQAQEGLMIAGTGVLSSWIDSFQKPAAIIIRDGRLYVSDLDNYRLLSFPLSPIENSPEGTVIIGYYGQGLSLNEINYVRSMTIDKQRDLFYLSDSENHRILKLNLTNRTLTLIAGTGTADSTNRTLNTPLGITVDEHTGAIYVADSQNHRIQKFNWNSTQGITIIGGHGSGESLVQLSSPSGVAIDSNGNVYIADTGNHRIVQWLFNNGQTRIIAGTGVPGTNNMQLNSPVQVKFDKHNNLYVVDQNNNRIQRFDLLNNGC